MENEENKKCYGNFSKGSASCRECDWKPWCMQAGDISLSGHRSYEQTCWSESVADPSGIAADSSTNNDEPKYTGKQMMEVMRRLIEVDDKRIREILRLKLSNPDISLNKIARSFNISRQAVGKVIARACREFEELKIVLKNRPGYNKWRRVVIVVPSKKKRKRSEKMKVHPDLFEECGI